MIICPNCKEEIEERSHFCDQCGQELAYCTQCGRVGKGRRCTHCGGLMASPDELDKKQNDLHVSRSSAMQAASLSFSQVTEASLRDPEPEGPQQPVASKSGLPSLTLYNPSLVISGVHAQLIYKPDTGWCIIDKHSSNGTKLNQRDLLPDVPMSIKTGDIVTIANINLQVSVN